MALAINIDEMETFNALISALSARRAGGMSPLQFLHIQSIDLMDDRHVEAMAAFERLISPETQLCSELRMLHTCFDGAPPCDAAELPVLMGQVAAGCPKLECWSLFGADLIVNYDGRPAAARSASLEGLLLPV